MVENTQVIATEPPIEISTLSDDVAERDCATDWQSLRMYVEAGSVTPVGLRLSMINDNTELNFGHGVMFSIEQYLDGGWEQVPFIGDFGWILPLFNVEPKTTVDENIFWEHMHGELPPGLYRIVRNFIGFDLFDLTPMLTPNKNIPRIPPAFPLLLPFLAISLNNPPLTSPFD